MSLLASLNRPVVETQPVLRRILKAMSEPGAAVMLPCTEQWAGISPAATALLTTLNEADTPLFIDPMLETSALRDSLHRNNGAPLTSEQPAAFALLHSDSDPDRRQSARTARR